MDYSQPRRADALAAAYVMGTLTPRARRRLDQLLPAHPGLRRAVSHWQEQLLVLSHSVSPVAPSPQLWQAIEARLFADRAAPRTRLAEALDAVFREKLSDRHNLDAVEPKLFGIGAESCTVGSHEFYLGYAISRRKLICLDAGHYHPTESIADKLSAVLPFVPGLLLHVSRGVRWDSDHVVTQTDELMAIAREVVANGYLGKVHLGLDYFDASINRVAAWVIGTRALRRALLWALLEPPAIRDAERVGDLTARLAWQEEMKALPFAAVWEQFCASQGVPADARWLDVVRRHERKVFNDR